MDLTMFIVIPLGLGITIYVMAVLRRKQHSKSDSGPKKNAEPEKPTEKELPKGLWSLVKAIATESSATRTDHEAYKPDRERYLLVLLETLEARERPLIQVRYDFRPCTCALNKALPHGHFYQQPRESDAWEATTDPIVDLSFLCKVLFENVTYEEQLRTPRGGITREDAIYILHQAMDMCLPRHEPDRRRIFDALPIQEQNALKEKIWRARVEYTQREQSSFHAMLASCNRPVEILPRDQPIQWCILLPE